MSGPRSRMPRVCWSAASSRSTRSRRAASPPQASSRNACRSAGVGSPGRRRTAILRSSLAFVQATKRVGSDDEYPRTQPKAQQRDNDASVTPQIALHSHRFGERLRGFALFPCTVAIERVVSHSPSATRNPGEQGPLRGPVFRDPTFSGHLFATDSRLTSPCGSHRSRPGPGKTRCHSARAEVAPPAAREIFSPPASILSCVCRNSEMPSVRAENTSSLAALDAAPGWLAEVLADRYIRSAEVLFQKLKVAVESRVASRMNPWGL